jgi:hypothetical protein
VVKHLDGSLLGALALLHPILLQFGRVTSTLFLAQKSSRVEEGINGCTRSAWPTATASRVAHTNESVSPPPSPFTTGVRTLSRSRPGRDVGTLGGMEAERERRLEHLEPRRGKRIACQP